MNRRQLLLLAALSPWLKPARADTLTEVYGNWPPPRPISRVYAAGPPASVLVYCLAPGMLLGWPLDLAESSRKALAPAQAKLPRLGRLAGRGSTVSLETLLALRPDVIVDAGTINDTYRSSAERVARQTGIPYLLADGDLPRTPQQLRSVGRLLGVAARGQMLAGHAQAILDMAAQARARHAGGKPPSVYMARSADGLETSLAGSIHSQAIEMAGGRNVARASAGGLARVSMEQLLGWDPDFILTQDPAFYAMARQSPLWGRLRAVRERRLYRVPMEPFGWLDVPPGVNRLAGLRWLLEILHPRPQPAEARRDLARFFQLFYGVDPSPALMDQAMRANA